MGTFDQNISTPCVTVINNRNLVSKNLLRFFNPICQYVWSRFPVRNHKMMYCRILNFLLPILRGWIYRKTVDKSSLDVGFYFEHSPEPIDRILPTLINPSYLKVHLSKVSGYIVEQKTWRHEGKHQKLRIKQKLVTKRGHRQIWSRWNSFERNWGIFNSRDQRGWALRYAVEDWLKRNEGKEER